MKTLTSFQGRVYTVVKQIPVGETRTYAWVARKAGSEGSARAVGNALNKNPFPVIIPCHRVVPSNGSPGKYYLGPGLKKKLLDAEKQAIKIT
jgi:methylated-DNA-[protein]-cysteine S-methyltransferase